MSLSACPPSRPPAAPALSAPLTAEFNQLLFGPDTLAPTVPDLTLSSPAASSETPPPLSVVPSSAPKFRLRKPLSNLAPAPLSTPSSPSSLPELPLDLGLPDLALSFDQRLSPLQSHTPQPTLDVDQSRDDPAHLQNAAQDQQPPSECNPSDDSPSRFFSSRKRWTHFSEFGKSTLGFHHHPSSTTNGHEPLRQTTSSFTSQSHRTATHLRRKISQLASAGPGRAKLTTSADQPLPSDPQELSQSVLGKTRTNLLKLKAIRSVNLRPPSVVQSRDSFSLSRFDPDAPELCFIPNVNPPLKPADSSSPEATSQGEAGSQNDPVAPQLIAEGASKGPEDSKSSEKKNEGHPKEPVSLQRKSSIDSSKSQPVLPTQSLIQALGLENDAHPHPHSAGRPQRNSMIETADQKVESTNKKIELVRAWDQNQAEMVKDSKLGANGPAAPPAQVNPTETNSGTETKMGLGDPAEVKADKDDGALGGSSLKDSTNLKKRTKKGQQLIKLFVKGFVAKTFPSATSNPSQQHHPPSSSTSRPAVLSVFPTVQPLPHQS